MLAIADDISGAAEVAIDLQRSTRTMIVLGDQCPDPHDSTAIPVFDLDTRQLPPAAAADRVADVVARGDSAVILKKIDSLLRGNVAAETNAVRRSGRGVVIAPARPAAGRTVLDGVLRVDGMPLDQTDTWRLEDVQPPATVGEAFDPLPTRVVDLDVVRGDPAALVDLLRHTVDRGVSPICDAETEHDLDRIVNAAMELEAPGLVGSASLAGALGRFLGSDQPASTSEPEPVVDHSRPLLVVVGTAAPIARTQIEHLLASGAAIALASDVSPDRIARELVGRPVVLSLNSSDVVPERSREIAKSLATLVSRVPGIDECDLVLTGGETARRVLDAQGVDVLWPVREIHPGAVHSRTAHGRSVVTRPGSFGEIASLTQIVQYWEDDRCSH